MSSSSLNGGKERQAGEIAEELWIFPYDGLVYMDVRFPSCDEDTESNKLSIRKFDDTIDTVGCLYADLDGYDHNSSCGRAVCAKSE